MKVAIIANHPESGEPIDGGVEAVTSYLVEAMAGIDDVDLYVLSFRIEQDRIMVNEKPGFTHYLLPFGGLGALTAFSRDQASLNKCLAEIQPDIVHSQGGGHHGILATRSGYPTVTTIHGIHVQEADYQRGFRRRLRTRLQGWMTRHYCIRGASNTILISPYVADFFGDDLAGQRFLVPNPVDERFFDVVRQEQPAKILFMGRLYALKGVKDLIEAASQLRSRHDLEIVLAGSLVDTEYVSELKETVNRLDMVDKVEFRGILPIEHVLDELSRCACLVLPSYQETAPMVIQEAMASGVPVIASNICGIPHQVEDKMTGLLFSPGNVDELASRLDLLLTDAAMREEFGRAAKLRAENEYRAIIVAGKTVDVYQKILQ